MTRRAHRQWLVISQVLVVAGLAAAAGWNLAAVGFSRLDPPAWPFLLALPMPGLLAWLAAVAAPRLLSRVTPRYPAWYRLTYDTSESWSDERVRRALLTLIKSGIGLDIIWARDGDELGCWLSVSGYEQVLAQLVRDVFPAGALEEEPAPAPGAGRVILHWKKRSDNFVPGPAQLCQDEGTTGVYFRWLSERTATVVIWGPGAAEAASRLSDDTLVGSGKALLQPGYIGENPWPDLPPFPASVLQPGLASLSRLERLAPGLRLNGAGGLALGRDSAGELLGFSLPGLAGMQPLRVFGHAAEAVVLKLAYQAIQSGRPVAFLDGEGTTVARLMRQLVREVAEKKVLLCDVERPAQSHFRLNPLWLPGDRLSRSELLPDIAGGWLAWLRELGVTPGGLGQAAYRHTQVATLLTALLAAERGLTLDAPSLRDALDMPDFLALLGGEELGGQALLGREIWQWWLAEGRAAPSFDVHLRLAHLRDRLNGLLELPEYGVLWRPPYLDPLAEMGRGVSLLWRLPDPRRRLPAYVTSQLAALTTMLCAWPPDASPILVILHELDLDRWATRLVNFAGARLVVSSRRVTPWTAGGISESLLLSRLERSDAEQMRDEMPGIRAGDLRRLSETRLIWQRGPETGTFDLID